MTTEQDEPRCAIHGAPEAQIASMKQHAAPVDVQDGGVNKHEKAAIDAIDFVTKGNVGAGDDPVGFCITAFVAQADKISKHEKAVKVLREALEWYASEAAYKWIDKSHGNVIESRMAVAFDGDERAKQAIATVDGMGDNHKQR